MYNQMAKFSLGPIHYLSMKNPVNTTQKVIERPPVVVVMGHVDHGKSTLLDYIRKSNVAEKEVGGITQRLGAYEVEVDKEGKKKKITFLDTPGHEAFQSIRARGAKTADIAILVVSAEDGVKPQTVQALKTILAEEIPYIVAINKIDKDGADIERTKQSLAEHEVYVEGYGGNISVVNVSAKTGEGVPELLDMILLQAELEELTADINLPGSGIVVETNVDKKKGNTATLVITNGTVRSGEYLVAGTSLSPVRIFENFLGKSIKEATVSSPVRIIGWDTLPSVGETFTTVENKKEAEITVSERKLRLAENKNKPATTDQAGIAVLPLIIKASETGSLEAMLHEISKTKHESMVVKIVQQGIGDIGESDIKTAAGIPGVTIVGFGVGIDTSARALAENQKTHIERFDIIYKFSEWLADLIKERAPKKQVEKMTGRAKILKSFSRSKDKQVLGGRVEEGLVKTGEEVKILRRDNDIGRGKIKELQVQKEKTAEIVEGREFGMMIESKTEIVPGDKIECFTVVEE
jgi:translation initiation factor IF-2